MAEEVESLEYTPTWIVAVVCSIIVIISLCVERLLHYLGKWLKHAKQHALFEALQKLKEELMLLGFISLLLTVSQGLISHMCIPASISSQMLPCKKVEETASGQEAHYHKAWSQRHLLSASITSQLEHCAKQGKVPMLSLEALHQLHIFIFVLAVVHMVFCATTMVLGGVRIRQWEHWEKEMKRETSKPEKRIHQQRRFAMERAMGFWRKSAVVSWVMSFFKQFYGSVTKSDYTALRSEFIMTHCGSNQDYDFHKYMMRALEADFKKVVGISWYLWLFVVIFLLLNINGWHTYFWLSFLPLILLLAVGAKLEHIIHRLAEEVAETMKETQGGGVQLHLSDEYFWFQKPGIVLYLIHFILFQNSFEIAFFFWIWSTYGFDSCIMEKVGYIVPRLVIGVIIQVLCSYSTLPLYAIVSHMGSMFKPEIFKDSVKAGVIDWIESAKREKSLETSGSSIWKSVSHHREADGTSSAMQLQHMACEAFGSPQIIAESPIVSEGITTSVTEVHLDSRQT